MVVPGDSVGGSAGRTSARQAVVVLAEPTAANRDQWATMLGGEVLDALLNARLLDVLTSLLQLNGATTTIVGNDLEATERLRLLTPPGVDLVTADPQGSDSGPLLTAAWAIAHLLEREFERVVVLRELVLPVSVRTVATALSVLATADLVAAPAPGGGLALVGAGKATGTACIGSIGEATLATLEQAAIEDGLVLRRVERQRLLDPGAGMLRLVPEIERLGEAAPHLRRWLADHGQRA